MRSQIAGFKRTCAAMVLQGMGCAKERDVVVKGKHQRCFVNAVWSCFQHFMFVLREELKSASTPIVCPFGL
jgi:hypothetical protein